MTHQKIIQANYIDCRSYKNLKDLSVKISQDLENVGYVIVKDFYIDVNNIEESKQKYLEISELIGKPVGHDANNKIIWDIKSNPESVSFIKTYSEHSHEAELHTDSQYSSYPEDFFGLLTLKKANCGGGVSYLLTLKDVLDDLRSLENGFEIEKTLRTTNFPFIVPNVFKKTKNEGHEFNYGPILRDNEIRFRIDTFEKAIIQRSDLCNNEQISAYKVLKEIILNNSKTLNLYLEPKDLIYINNKTMLHGRGEFTDNDRHLLRIRMNKFSYSS
ncbi:TauD/TfdA family dioxygenase [Wenyingzhuangia sp. IMCC45533]